MLTFDKVTLAEAAAEFNRYNATKLVLGDETAAGIRIGGTFERSEEHTSELQSLMRISYAVFCLKNKNFTTHLIHTTLNLALTPTLHIHFTYYISLQLFIISISHC